jgi:hypothetical protein
MSARWVSRKGPDWPESGIYELRDGDRLLGTVQHDKASNRYVDAQGNPLHARFDQSQRMVEDSAKGKVTPGTQERLAL